jgi:hypothetical protein
MRRSCELRANAATRARRVGVESRADRLRLVGGCRRRRARTRPDEALGLPERRRRVLEPERRDLARAGAGVGGELGDEPPVERGLGIDRLVLQQQAQRAGLPDRRGQQRRDAEVGAQTDVRVAADELGAGPATM